MRLVSLVLLAACNTTSFGDLLDPSGDGVVPDFEIAPVIDRWDQPPTRRADVLWIVDNSCSMSEEQSRIARNAPSFVNHFLADDKLDWHIGFVTTDMFTSAGEGRMLPVGGRRFLTRDAPNATALFEDTIQQGNSGPAPERGLDASWKALTPPLTNGVNGGFLRDDADTHVIVISDQRDYSTLIRADAYITFLTGLKRDRNATFSGIVGTRNRRCDGWVEPGTGYLEVIAATGGILVDICEPDWGPVLDDLGELAASAVGEFFLTQVPKVSTLEVVVEEPGGQIVTLELDTGFTYNRRRNAVRIVGLEISREATVTATYLPARLAGVGDDAPELFDTGP